MPPDGLSSCLPVCMTGKRDARSDANRDAEMPGHDASASETVRYQVTNCGILPASRPCRTRTDYRARSSDDLDVIRAVKPRSSEAPPETIGTRREPDNAPCLPLGSSIRPNGGSGSLRVEPGRA